MQAIRNNPRQFWLTIQLAEQLCLVPANITGRKLRTEYGVDSMRGMLLSGDLEAWLGLQRSPTILVQ